MSRTQNLPNRIYSEALAYRDRRRLVHDDIDFDAAIKHVLEEERALYQCYINGQETIGDIARRLCIQETHIREIILDHELGRVS